MTQANGSISVTSAPEQGTTFRLLLPSHGRDADPIVTPSPSTLTPVVCAHKTILLVEDDAVLRVFLARALDECGCAVLQANNGMEAARIMAERAGRIDLVVTDLVMPEMNGLSLLTLVRQAYPSVRVLLMSGNGAELLRESGLLEHASGASPETSFIAKPFEPAVLQQRIRTMLAE